MATLVIRKLDDGVKDRLQKRAADHGNSMEEEVRRILHKAVPEEPENWGQHLVETTRELFGPNNGVDLELPPREPFRELPSFD